MIQQREVCICDICGHIEVAQENPGQYNDTFYTAPEGWSKGTAPSAVDICPACAKLLAVKCENARIPAVSTVLFKDTPAVITDSLTQAFAQRLHGGLGENLTADSVTKRE